MRRAAMEERAFVPVGVAVLTISDTRSLETDKSGALIAAQVEAMGHRLAARALVADDVEAIQAAARRWIADAAVDVVIMTGGTGVTRRDVTPDAVAALGGKLIPGFGELFRWLSYADIGTSTIQSRAEAWLCEATFVFVLPGSMGAVRLAMEKILVQQLDSRHRPCNFIELLPRIRGQERG
jgi:molybdenum cofactor biosynthesis protein B